MDINDFETVGEWYRKMKAEDYIVPLTLYYTLIKIMKDKHITFAAAYKELLADGKIQESSKKIIFKL